MKIVRAFTTRDLAEEICNSESSTSSVPTLVTISSAEEQKFLSEYIFNYSDSNNVWIGAERTPGSSTEFEWIDGSAIQHFTNWAIGRPSDDIRRSCVQMQSNLSRLNSDMEWVDISCTIGNWFICQELQTWSPQRIQQAILDARREKQHLTNQLDLAKIRLKDLQETFTIQMANVTNQLDAAKIERSNFTRQMINVTNQLNAADIERNDFTRQVNNVTYQLNIANIERRNLQNNPGKLDKVYMHS